MIHVRTARTSVVIDASSGVPAIHHWGAPVNGPFDGRLFEGPVLHGGLDVVVAPAIVRQHGDGYLGRPGLEGGRLDGTDWAPRFVPHGSPITQGDSSVTMRAFDAHASLTLDITLEIDDADVLCVRATLANVGAEPYRVDALRLSLPLPGHACETLTFTGRHTLEWQPVRGAWPSGTTSVENRVGRTSHDRPPMAIAGVTGFDEDSGEVWAAHLAWSGNTAMHMDAGADGLRSLQSEELLSPGEVVLAPGESYRTPALYAVYSASGLTGVSESFHALARSFDSTPARPRPVTLNTWEAIYFDHDEDRVKRLADGAASVGIERFVLDDGWFHGRRHDHAGLGDWWVDPTVWPNGLHGVISHVRSLGMEFGIWMEPEMVNPDSDLYRAHPDWVLTDDRYEPVLSRNQLVLDLVRPEVQHEVYERVHALLRDHDIAYVKWDMNRELVHASHRRVAAVHGQTRALYALLDRLREAHPDVELESCASGGGRVDLEIAQRTSRFWTSDNNDALDRQRIQRGYSYFFPPERMGAHVGPTVCHSTGRSHTLAFRGATAMFGHFGVEWDLLDATATELADLAQVISLHKELRGLLHGGDSIRFDHPNPTVLAHGVYAKDRHQAVVSVAQMASPRSQRVEALRLPGLPADKRYRVSLIRLPGDALRAARRQPSWIDGGLEATGAQLAAIGIPLPTMRPESAILIRLQRT